jgi:REP element-mobilizing transposase RayT
MRKGWWDAGVARNPRIERAGAWHHVSARGIERRAIYRDERDPRHFVELLGEAVELFGWRLHAYVLMDNHFHLLVETPEPNLGRAMQWLNTSYCVWFNRRHGRAGHLLQGRFKSIVVDPIGWGLELSRYIHLNPVRVGRLGLDKGARRNDHIGAGVKPKSDEVRARIQRLRGYRWSSYRAYIGLTKCPPWLECETVLQLGGNRKEEAAGNYRRYAEDAIRQGLAAGPWEQMRDRAVLGGVEFARSLAKGLGLGASKKAQGRRMAAPSVEEIIKAVEAVKGEKWSDFRDRHGDWGRDLVFYIGRKGWAMRLKDLGAAAGGLDEVAVSMAARRVPMRGKNDRALAEAIETCKQKLQMLNV